MKRMKLWTIVVALLLMLGTLCYASLTAKISVGLTTDFRGSGDLSTPTDAMNISRAIEFTSGTGADQANVLFADSRTLADGASEVLDLYASGTLKDPLGGALTIEKVKAIYVYNTSADASLLVGGGTTPVGLCSDASDILKLPPGGKFVFSAPGSAGVATTTNKNLKFEHDGTGTSTLTYEVVVIGVD